MLTKDEAAFYIGIHKKTLTRIMNSSDFYPMARIGHKRGSVFINREKLDRQTEQTGKQYKAYSTIKKWADQDRQKASQKAQTKLNRFCNYQQRSIDFNELERMEMEYNRREPITKPLSEI